MHRKARHFITYVHSDHGGEFENKVFEEYCAHNEYFKNFSSPRSLQQNGVVVRKNWSLQETTRTMLLEYNIPDHFWAEAVSTTYHIINRCHIRPITKKTPYELWRGKKPKIIYFHPFRCKCFIHNNRNNKLGKFDPWSKESIFLGYSPTSRAYQDYNKKILCVEESMHIIFDETNNSSMSLSIDEE